MSITRAPSPPSAAAPRPVWLQLPPSASPLRPAPAPAGLLQGLRAAGPGAAAAACCETARWAAGPCSPAMKAPPPNPMPAPLSKHLSPNGRGASRDKAQHLAHRQVNLLPLPAFASDTRCLLNATRWRADLVQRWRWVTPPGICQGLLLPQQLDAHRLGGGVGQAGPRGRRQSDRLWQMLGRRPGTCRLCMRRLERCGVRRRTPLPANISSRDATRCSQTASRNIVLDRRALYAVWQGRSEGSNRWLRSDWMSGLWQERRERPVADPAQ